MTLLWKIKLNVSLFLIWFIILKSSCFQINFSIFVSSRNFTQILRRYYSITVVPVERTRIAFVLYFKKNSFSASIFRIHLLKNLLRSVIISRSILKKIGLAEWQNVADSINVSYFRKASSRKVHFQWSRQYEFLYLPTNRTIQSHINHFLPGKCSQSTLPLILIKNY